MGVTNGIPLGCLLIIRVGTVNFVHTLKATLWRIDDGHVNPLAAWEAMGSPAVPSDTQLEALIASSIMHPEQVPVIVVEVGASRDGQRVDVELTMVVDMSPNAAVMVTFN
jgi:hypothetical protein